MIASTKTDGRRRPIAFSIAQAARQRLLASPYRMVQRVACHLDLRGRLVLRGRLTSFYLKQLAQEAVAGVQGVTQVINETEVG